MSNWTPAPGGPESNRRRSQRVMLSLPLTVSTENAPRNSSFEETTHTLIVSAHGALIPIAGKVEKGQTLRLINSATRVEQTCKVTYLGPASGGRVQVGVEFSSPAPEFWQISFPPSDWIAPEIETVSAKTKKI